MIVIADAGGTSTDWAVCLSDQIVRFQTHGLNLAHDDVRKYVAALKPDLLTYREAAHVHIYAAGLQESQEDQVNQHFEDVFSVASIEVASDLLGAARGLLGKDPGFAGILGTGANFSGYDGRNLTTRIPALGYILGDEGSGVHIGKKLVVSYLRDQLPPAMHDAFRSAYQMEEADVLKEVYGKQNGKSFLSSLTPFVKQHIGDKFIRELLRDCFRDHFRVIGPVVAANTVSYTGSISHVFEAEFRELALEMNIHVGTIAASPMPGLIEYHTHVHN